MAYKTSSADLERRSSLSNGAVSSREDSVGIQQRAATEVAATSLDADDEGEVTLGSSGSANNWVLWEVTLRELRVLGNGCGGAEGRDRKGNEDVFDLHLEEGGEAAFGWKVSEAKVGVKDWFASEGCEVIFVFDCSLF
jgi:hypothetical protein